ncbi:MAG: hypothetical protein LV480_02075 [Methylacidiphilales bacterium]|nr:hypothetical protein [Candidatus Methylacidiphilales bacterium]
MPPPITACLSPGEKILWHAQPRPYVFMLRGLTSIFYGMTWSILGAFWYHGAGGIGQYSAFEGWWRLVPLLSLPFIFAGWSFFLYPIRLGIRARRTWYVITNRRIFIAQLHGKNRPDLRVFTRDEMGPPRVLKRLDGLDEIVLTRRAQEKPYLAPPLDSGFFGIADGEAALAAILDFESE